MNFILDIRRDVYKEGNVQTTSHNAWLEALNKTLQIL
jgi:hypothetical protein